MADASIASAFATPVAMAIENSRLYSQMEQLATTDMLTGLSNRRDFSTKAEIELERARRYNRSLALIMVDIDHFKTTNDTYGHQAGDQVLRTLAVECFQTVLRKIDIAGRYGGEEFILLLPETSRKDAILAAERLRSLVENTICHTPAADIRVTISLGVATLNQKNNRLQDLIEDADKALYLAKKNGRNRVEIFE